MTAAAELYDIAIIGGGMVGASLAAKLPRHLRIAVIESFAMPAATSLRYQPSFDARATALSKSSQDFFSAAGIWPSISEYAQPISDVHVSDKGHWGSVLLSDSVESFDALGYVIENACLGRSLLAAVGKQNNVDFICPATVASLQYKSQLVELALHSDGAACVLSCRLVIIADGANSSMCQRLGIHAEIRDYGQTAIVANIASNEAHKGVAYERFTAQGPMALLPLLGTQAYAYRSALIWTMPTAEAQSLLNASDADFLRALQEQFGFRQGHFIHVGARASYLLRLSSAKEQVRQRTVVLGNAAHSLHPVAGQGFNLALRDAAVLADIIAKADSAKEDFASLPVLQRYMDKQGRDQWLTIAFSDVLPSLFSSNSRPLKIARGLGLLSLELLPGFKSAFVKFATGIRQGKA